MEHVLPIFAGEELFILNCESDWWFGVIANERLEGKKVQDGRARSRHNLMIGRVCCMDGLVCDMNEGARGRN